MQGNPSFKPASSSTFRSMSKSKTLPAEILRRLFFSKSLLRTFTIYHREGKLHLRSSASRTSAEKTSDLVSEYMEPGEDMWKDDRTALWDTDGLALTVSVQWILKCRCGDACSTGSSTQEITAQATAASGEIILHRVHRTAAP